MKKIARSRNFYIATGHHPHDFLETALINMIRGTGPKGLQTLPVFTNNIFRPLLNFSPEEISKTVKNENWVLFEDESNFDEKFLRNRIRKNVVPLLLKEGLEPLKLYENFHPQNDVADAKLTAFQITNPSMIRIDKNSLEFQNSFFIKELIDIHLKLFSSHPLKKQFFIDLEKLILIGKSFLIENSECYFWRKKKGDLALIPKNSLLLQNPKSFIQNGNLFIKWNRNEYETSAEYTSGLYSDGLKIFVNKMNKFISEIFREKEIPLPVRKHIPILFKEDKPVKILFEMFDPSVKNFPDRNFA